MMNDNAAPTRIILIRHGQTPWNQQQVFRGRADIPLDDIGLQQAEALATALEDEPIALVVASPISRAVQTAQPLARAHGLAVIWSEAFTDVDFGSWEGMTADQVERQYPDLYAAWLTHPERVHFPGGEDLGAVGDRAFAALQDLVERNPGQTLALVTHRVVNKVIICRVLGLGDAHFWQIKQDTACLNRLSFGESGWVVECLNDTSHVRHLSAATADF